jgi:dienelactone hydrolase
MEPVSVRVQAGDAALSADLAVPGNSGGLILFAHGSGSSRHSPRNRRVARFLNEAGFATLLLDLLTPDEERVDQETGEFRFDIGLLAGRLLGATRWATADAGLSRLAIGYFGASTGAAAALMAAARLPGPVGAVVSRGGRPDLAGEALPDVSAPTLLIVGGEDETVLDLNRHAMEAMQCEKMLEIIPGATHLFEEPGALDQVSRLAGDWFARHLRRT